MQKLAQPNDRGLEGHERAQVRGLLRAVGVVAACRYLSVSTWTLDRASSSFVYRLQPASVARIRARLEREPIFPGGLGGDA
jgi:hypothetical protein